METFIMIVMLCHLDFTGQEGCIPMTPSPQVYYSSREACMEKSIKKMDDMRTTAVYNNIQITGLYVNCLPDKTKQDI